MASTASATEYLQRAQVVDFQAIASITASARGDDGSMSQEQRALMQHLFSEITTTLEIAQSLAIEGQHPNLRSQQARDISQRILKSIDDAACLAAAVGALSERAGDQKNIRESRSRTTGIGRRVSKIV